MNIPLPQGEYIKKVTINDESIDIDFAKRQKIALVLISLNPNYWPYARQVIEDCKQNFLPQHNVEYFLWTDIPKKNDYNALNEVCSGLPLQAEVDAYITAGRGYPSFSKETIAENVQALWKRDDVTLVESDPAPWPTPTLMRYHLFLNEEEKLKDFDYIFYLDADMRVVEKISDEVLSEGLTAAEHPMYSLAPKFIPPYEPNKDSTAYIERPGAVITDEAGKPRFKPYYYAGGFQGGKSAVFIEAMKTMKKNIDTDFDHNYTAIWNDESHWNKFLSEYAGPLVVLSPSYIYPDSLIKEYYEPLWGRKYEPKIITLTKPFSLSKESGEQLAQMLGAAQPASPLQKQMRCPTCNDLIQAPADHLLIRVVECPGSGKAHQMEMNKI